MQTKDHYLLGHFLLKRYGTHIDPICQKLFLLGCIEPDWNFVTYTRGSIKYQFLHGHNAENAQNHLTHLTERLMKSGVRTPLQWFRFGAALHYLADSFTFAHNRIFAGNLKEHRLYEKMLHTAFAEYLQTHCSGHWGVDKVSHERYLADGRSYQTDCRYILGSALALCGQLSIQWAPIDLVVGSEAFNFYGKV